MKPKKLNVQEVFLSKYSFKLEENMYVLSMSTCI